VSRVMAELDTDATNVETTGDGPATVYAPTISNKAGVAVSSPADAALDSAVAVLCTQLAADSPCGPDLDAQGDVDYLNFFARAELVLPESFFSALDGTPFDRTSVDIDGQLEAIKPLLARTRDVRLLIMQARLQILNRDLAGFAVSVAAAAYWLESFWDQVHPLPEGSALTARSAAVSALDIPTVIFPLQYAPLFDASRLGTVTYRTLLIATDEAKPRGGESKLAASAIIEARGNADPARLAASRKHIAMLSSALDRIRNAFAARDAAAGLDNATALVSRIQEFIDPGKSVKTLPVQAHEGSEGPPAALVSSGLSSRAEVSEALAAIAGYYSLKEPSSPSLPLVRQAHQLIGKSFFEVINILIPNHVEKAAFQIGGGKVFELPIGKLSDLSRDAPPTAGEAGQETPGEFVATSETMPRRFHVESRAQAITLLDEVQRYFRSHEPSSPVPMLCDRARAFADSDFMTVLRDILPKAALKDIGAEK
jgi:type VI secretion system protein ImpA